VNKGKKSWFRGRLAAAVGLVLLSAVLYCLTYLAYRDWNYIQKYVLLHLSFLPIHALVIGLILEELISLRDKHSHRRRLNVFLGVFFRQMGVEFFVRLSELLSNLDQLEEIITVYPHWRRRHFQRARRRLLEFKPLSRGDLPQMERLAELLQEKEPQITGMLRNPGLWEFESLYRTLVALYHLIEEFNLRGPLWRVPPPQLAHLAGDASQALRFLLLLWLEYLEFLKRIYPHLFDFPLGVHNTVQPVLLELGWQSEE